MATGWESMAKSEGIKHAEVTTHNCKYFGWWWEWKKTGKWKLGGNMRHPITNYCRTFDENRDSKIKTPHRL